jgi:3-dehydroquinate synthase
MRIPSALSTDGGPEMDVEIRVQTSGLPYPVRVGPGILTELPRLLAEEAPAHRYVLVGDERVMELHGDQVARSLAGSGAGGAQQATSPLGKVSTREAGSTSKTPPNLKRTAAQRPTVTLDRLTFPAGEEHKTREEWARLTDQVLELGVGRDGCIIALGGGVTGDLAGFVAATYMRGIPVVQLPTSLVAMVDSSVGGKTGVDLPGGKNLVGAFHPPRFVLADTRLARTLPPEERSQGLAEAVKHGAIVDAGYMDRIVSSASSLLAGDEAETAWMVARSVEIKAWVVSRDEREGSLRQILNFGHTLGHALEAVSGYTLPHGSAVGIGMVLEARLGEALGVSRPGTSEQVARAVEAVGLPTVPPPGSRDSDHFMEHLGRDKKARGGRPRFVLLEEVGRIHKGDEGSESWSHPVPPEAIREVLQG